MCKPQRVIPDQCIFVWQVAIEGDKSEDYCNKGCVLVFHYSFTVVHIWKKNGANGKSLLRGIFFHKIHWSYVSIIKSYVVLTKSRSAEKGR